VTPFPDLETQPEARRRKCARGARRVREVVPELGEHGRAYTGDAARLDGSARYELKGLMRPKVRLPNQDARGASSATAWH